ncbi:MAG: aminopeptidase [Acidobacteriaceae bacterium]|nr:aminopeptidase [Acidobacteriaceae bacterium]MBV8570057.1 aminopeptidase [Acidobacteriaceae bacterium]
MTSNSTNSRSFDPELIPGAHNAIFVCLKVQPAEKVTLITDHACEEIAASLADQLDRTGCRYGVYVLENLAPRPLTNMPREILDDMESSQVSIFAVQAQPDELKTRMQMCEVVNRKKLRHAHMVNIEKRIMLNGMRADFNEVDELTLRVMNIVNKAKRIRAVTPAGTDIVAELSPEYNWIKTSGIISRDKWGNLPGGETFTAPLEVNGTFVVDGVVGDYLCAKFGDLKNNPLMLKVERNRLTGVSCSNQDLRDEFWNYTHRDANSDRVGEFAIGTNIACTEVVGNILQDEKIPGVHMAFGDPYGAHTGAPWSSTTHIDVVGRNFDIWADERQIMRSGHFIV